MIVGAPPAVLKQIANLETLRDQGILTEKEFEAAQQRLLATAVRG